MSSPDEEIKSRKTVLSQTGTGVEIDNEVIQVVAGVAVAKTPGVAAMASTGGGIAEMLGKKNLSRGIRLAVDNGVVNIDVFIIARYGVNLDTLFRNIQRNVKEAVENMTGFKVETVNVFTQGLEFEGEILVREEEAVQ